MQKCFCPVDLVQRTVHRTRKIWFTSIHWQFYGKCNRAREVGNGELLSTKTGGYEKFSIIYVDCNQSTVYWIETLKFVITVIPNLLGAKLMMSYLPVSCDCLPMQWSLLKNHYIPTYLPRYIGMQVRDLKKEYSALLSWRTRVSLKFQLTPRTPVDRKKYCNLSCLNHKPPFVHPFWWD